MIWTIIAGGIVLVRQVVPKREEDDDPVWQTVVAVDELCDEIARWEPVLWSLWAMAVIENLLLRLDGSDKILYLNKLETKIIELQQEIYESESMSEKGVTFLYFEQETTDLQAH